MKQQFMIAANVQRGDESVERLVNVADLSCRGGEYLGD